VACQQFILTLLPPKTSLVSFPPYFPPEIQRFDEWIQPDELMMSDIPWAVAWYGDRQCSWLTANARSDFFQLNDYIKHVSALYLTLQTLDGRLTTDYRDSGANSWYRFVIERFVFVENEGPDPSLGRAYFRNNYNDPQKKFPLYAVPSDVSAGLFLADRPRWRTQ
jgi:hypothetical protein